MVEQLEGEPAGGFGLKEGALEGSGQDGKVESGRWSRVNGKRMVRRDKSDKFLMYCIK